MVVNLIKMDFLQFSIFQTNKITHVKSTVLLNLENLLPVLFFRLFSINIDRNPLLFVAFQPFYICLLYTSPGAEHRRTGDGSFSGGGGRGHI